MTTIADPATITTDQLSAALESWGIDLTDVIDIRLSADHRGGGIEIRRRRRDPDGKLIHAGHDCATVTVVVGIVQPKPPVEIA